MTGELGGEDCLGVGVVAEGFVEWEIRESWGVASFSHSSEKILK